MPGLGSLKGGYEIRGVQQAQVTTEEPQRCMRRKCSPMPMSFCGSYFFFFLRAGITFAATANDCRMSTAPHVSDEEARAQRSEDFCPGHLPGKLNAHILPSEPILERMHSDPGQVTGDKARSLLCSEAPGCCLPLLLSP